MKAEVAVKGNLFFGTNGFRVVTPHAGKRASFEKDRCSDAGAIIEGKAVDIGNKRLFFYFYHVCPGSISLRRWRNEANQLCGIFPVTIDLRCWAINANL
jgi:hypothetical protein